MLTIFASQNENLDYLCFKAAFAKVVHKEANVCRSRVGGNPFCVLVRTSNYTLLTFLRQLLLVLTAFWVSKR